MSVPGLLLSVQSSVRLLPGFIHAEIDGEIVAMSVETGTCYGLDPVGARVWQLIGEFTPVAKVCAALEREYDVAPEVCEHDVLQLLEELRSKGIIETKQ